MTRFDLVIRGGVVVDGNGGQPVTADVAVADGVIREVGRVPDRGRRDIDADGALVAPGFVDLHTHYDGQATWDDRLQPSTWHGVTTVVMGNCGVGFAPAMPGDRDRLIELMEGIEDIPGVAMHEGLPWSWESFPDYLAVLESRRYDADVLTQVPHAALRVHVMGERAAAYELATDDEIERMARLAKEAVLAGAFGFTTSRVSRHKSATGEITPSYEASGRELVEIARAMGTAGKGVLQLVTDWDDVDADFGLMREMVAASGRPLSVTLTHKDSEPDRHRKILQRITDANRDGLAIKGQVGARGVGLLLGLPCTLHPFITNPVWVEELSALPPAEQARRMSDPVMRARILGAQTDEVDPLMIGGWMIHRWDAMHELGDPPDYEPPLGSTVADIAARSGRSPVEVAYDLLIKDEGSSLLHILTSGYDHGTLDVAYELLAHEHTVPGLSDGGAHVGTICDGSFPTTLLQHWVRDRDGNRLELPFVIRRQCRDTARAVGLADRGVIAPGYKADVNVIDFDALHTYRPEMHYDLPAGGKRLLQRVDGYKHTVVSGLETYRDGQPTGELPGRLVRSLRRLRRPARAHCVFAAVVSSGQRPPGRCEP
jgi:N-acyl-D-aspartate/D-glutamate deacylase